MKRTTLYDHHLQLQGKISDYGQWELPAYFSSAEEESLAAHNGVVLFDASASGKFTIKGGDAETFLRKVLVSSMDNLIPGTFLQSCMCNDYGGIIDTVTVYCTDKQEYLLTGSEHLTEKNFRWLTKHLSGDTEFTDISDEIACIKCIGPLALPLVSDIFPTLSETDFPLHSFIQSMYDGRPVIIARSCESECAGCLILLHDSSVLTMWKSLMQKGEHYNLIPAGVEALNILSCESVTPADGYELSESVTPVEGGLSCLINSDDDFIGKRAIEEQIKSGITGRLIQLKLSGNKIPEKGSSVFSGDTPVAEVSRSVHSPFYGSVMALAVCSGKAPDTGNIISIRNGKKSISGEVISPEKS